MAVRPKRVLLAAAVAILALASPAGAFAKGAGGCNASACKVYTEPPGSAGASKAGGEQQPTQPVPVTSKTSRLLAHAGKDKALLAKMLSNPAYGATRGLENSGVGSTASPSLLGAVLDLGAGPLALLAFLVASALGLAIHKGMRRRRRHAGP